MAYTVNIGHLHFNQNGNIECTDVVISGDGEIGNEIKDALKKIQQKQTININDTDDENIDDEISDEKRTAVEYILNMNGMLYSKIESVFDYDHAWTIEGKEYENLIFAITSENEVLPKNSHPIGSFIDENEITVSLIIRDDSDIKWCRAYMEKRENDENECIKALHHVLVLPTAAICKKTQENKWRVSEYPHETFEVVVEEYINSASLNYQLIGHLKNKAVYMLVNVYNPKSSSLFHTLVKQYESTHSESLSSPVCSDEDAIKALNHVLVVRDGVAYTKVSKHEWTTPECPTVTFTLSSENKELPEPLALIGHFMDIAVYMYINPFEFNYDHNEIYKQFKNTYKQTYFENTK